MFNLSRYDGGIIVERAVQLSEPIIVVSINYRYSVCFHFHARTDDLISSRLSGEYTNTQQHPAEY